MSGKVGRRDFNYLFGADESDEENVQEHDNLMEKDSQYLEPLEEQNKHSIDGRRKSENSSRDSDIDKKCDSEVPENTHRKKTEEEQHHEKKRSCSLEDILKKRKKMKQDEESQIIDLNKTNNTPLEHEKIRKSIVNLEQDKHIAENNKKQKLGKAEVGGLVVKLLMPAYAEKRFQSRDAFKTLARNISHALVNKGKGMTILICKTRNFKFVIKN